MHNNKVRGNVNTALNDKVRPIPMPLLFLCKIICFSFHNFVAKSVLTQIKNSFSLFSLFDSAAAKTQEAFVNNKPLCSIHKSKSNSDDNQPYRHM